MSKQISNSGWASTVSTEHPKPFNKPFYLSHVTHSKAPGCPFQTHKSMQAIRQVKVIPISQIRKLQLDR